MGHPEGSSSLGERLNFGSLLRRLNAWVTEGTSRLLRRHGRVVGSRPWPFLLAPLLVTGLFGVGALRFKADQEVRQLFTPTDAESHREFRLVQDYFGDPGGLYDLVVFVRARDGGSLIRAGYPGKVLRLMDHLTGNYSIRDERRPNETLTFSRDLQINHQTENYLLKTILKLLSSSIPHFLTYPVTVLQNENFYIGDIFSTITTNPISHKVTGVKTIVVHFRSAYGDDEHFKLLKQWTYNFLAPDTIYEDPDLVFTPWNDHLMTRELLRMSGALVPYVLLSFLVLMCFAVGASITDSVISSKPWEALAGVCSVGLAVVSSFGFLFLIGYSFVGTLAVMPVLVLAMGLDVTFIVLRNWRSTNPELDPASRLAETWAESGTSVVITSLTNVMSTAIGAFTNTPAIHTFCLSTTVAVIFLFFYQITFFAAAIALGGRREAKNRNSVLCCLKSKPNIRSSTVRKQPLEPRRSLEFRDPSSQTTSISVIGRATPAVIDSKNIATRILNDDWWYKISLKLSVLLCNIYCRLAVILVLVVYWITSVWGCLHLQLGLSPEKLFLPDSAILTSVRIDKTNILLNVFVHKPPDFTNESQTQIFYNMLNDLESMPECLGPSSTSLWLRAYENYASFLGQNFALDFYTSLNQFLELSDSFRWRPYVDVSVNETTGETTLHKFFFSVAYRRHRSWTERVAYTNNFRSVINRYTDLFNITLYCDDNNNFIVDQLEAIPGNTLQDVLITGLCMAIICLVFIPNFFNTICAMITIFSINVGVFGYLVHWDVALDPVSMTSLLMSIGYSVDFTSHISFHYYISSGTNQKEKLISALSSIGLPMIETGFSTILSVGCLCLIQSYLVWVYFKTTFLVVVLGLFHGLIVLPMFMAWLPMDVWDWIYSGGEGGAGSTDTDRNGSNGVKNGRRGLENMPPKSPNPDIVQIALGEFS